MISDIMILLLLVDNTDYLGGVIPDSLCFLPFDLVIFLLTHAQILPPRGNLRSPLYLLGD